MLNEGVSTYDAQRIDYFFPIIYYLTVYRWLAYLKSGRESLMEWQQVIGFHYVATLGSITRAADATFRTQSALSQQIKALEEELGCLLFERIGRRRLKLTSAGEKFLQFTAQFLADWDQLMKELRKLKGRYEGHLQVAAQFAPLYYLLPKVIKKYTRLFPLVEMTILERTPLAIIDLVKAGDVDFGISRESVVPKDLNAIRFLTVDNFLLVPLGHPLGREKQVSIEQIAQYPLVLPPKFLKYRRQSFEEKFETLGIPYRISVEATNIFLCARYVKLGLGIGVWANWYDLKNLKKDKLELIPINHILKPDYIVAVLRKDTHIQSFKSAFLIILFLELANSEFASSALRQLERVGCVDGYFLETLISNPQVGHFSKSPFHEKLMLPLV
jgi:DNA-binding transcriptional LysR family regulator